MKRLDKDIWIGLVMLIVAVGFWLEAGKIRVSPLDDPVGAAGLPKMLAYALGALAILLIARSLIGAALAVAPAPAVLDETPPVRERMKPHLRAIGMLGIGVGYLLVVATLGYAISVMGLILLVSIYIGAPLGLRTVLVAVGGGIAFHLLFVEFLDIPLPAGLLGRVVPGLAG
ncbi:hypothetical protein OG2516_00634 [Oceanicola granulosus HTCC2516]|uniref:DUF1468 domain-containing protein n=1 Tax=Oceanicola granulosus (strain ATCC BAA-861 / DSM 15982 / KCTC 12143 / HTCC2516) TaxID=314256 RepID=Q2CJB3_OCEGH|nr:tripartite tricarboxylate transporter TctB family protein [Oceanicola granulosus]EAR52687.1 hypothetical protein OG2516_00634 [Oceanicola granulosus HTCC2516]